MNFVKRGPRFIECCYKYRLIFTFRGPRCYKNLSGFYFQGAQIFEALGLHDEVVNMCFRGTASRIGGVTFKELATEVTL